MSILRRAFVRSTAAAATVAALNCSTFANNAASEMPIIDTHQHLWDLQVFSPPWLAGASDKIRGKHSMKEYLEATDGLNLIKAIYMEVDAAVEDQNKEADFILEVIRRADSPTVAAVISGRPASSGFVTYIDRFRNEPKIKGVRQVLHASSAKAGLCLDPTFVKSIQHLGSIGKSFDLCMRPAELSDGAKLVSQCPDTKFIVDHCGNADPHAWGRGKADQVASHKVDQWQRDMAQLASHKNVVCKISGIVARMPEGWQTDDIAPAINFCLDTFGPDRVMFGGDWPVCKIGASFAQWVTALKQIVQNRPMSEQRKLFSENAARFYGV